MCSHLQVVVWHLYGVWYVDQGRACARTLIRTNAIMVHDMNAPLGPSFTQLYSLVWCWDARGPSFRKSTVIYHSTSEFGFLVITGVPGR